MRFLLILLVKGYRLIFSPYVGRSCRFAPTCSQYALDALNEYGAVKGSWLALRRIGRCHPWHAGGFDPVPPKNRPDHASRADCCTGDSCHSSEPGPEDKKKTERAWP
jgi:putative membrane protein insertion efficiency factor